MFEQLAEYVRSLALKPMDKDGGKIIPIPPGWKLEMVDADALAPAPSRITQDVTLFDVESYCQYIMQFAGSETVILADFNLGLFKALIDYHAKGSPSWVSHVATLRLQFTHEFSEWKKCSGRPMSQVEFARFLEQRIAEIREPAPADLMQSVLEFQAAKQVSFRSGARLANGLISLSYVEEGGQTGGTMQLPANLKLGLPVFYGGPAYEITALLRWRIAEQKLVLYYEIDNLERFVQDSVKDAAVDIHKCVGIKPLFGSVD